MKKINDIIIVGGGTAGCISALILKTRFPQINIKIIESSNVGIVGVGESSTEHWKYFCSYVGIPELSVILECNATFKLGVYFENWSENDFIHTISYPFNHLNDRYYKVYGHLIANNSLPVKLVPSSILKNKLGLTHFNNINDSPTNQYHFDTFALNKFLHKECDKKGIKIIIDDIQCVAIDDKTDEILSISSEKDEYFADFFIDCSGFSRLLLGDVYDIKWVSYSEYLPVNSAIAFATEEMAEYNMYTKSTARKAGWSWMIPTQTRTGNGYVYCDKFINKDEAHLEMEEVYGQSLEIVREFKFDPGRMEKAWHKNCFAVGLSQSFVEPLEATSIGSVIQQMFCFINFLPSYDSKTCNEKVNDIFDNIVDYVQAHYLVKKEDTPFWKEVKYNLKLTNNLKNYLEMWKNRLPSNVDISCPWAMFYGINYIPILHGLGWFNIQKIKYEYENFGRDDSIEPFLTQYENEIFWLGHKELIKILKNGYHKHYN
jgi:tryptophan halogenase